MTPLAIALSIVGAVLLAAFVLLGAWIDGRRQRLRERGLHPTTTDDGSVVAQESQPNLGSTKQ